MAHVGSANTRGDAIRIQLNPFTEVVASCAVPILAEEDLD